MLTPADQLQLITRLNRVEGQVRGIKRMVQEPRHCVEILQQLTAAEAALNRVAVALLRIHVERCVPDGIAKGPVEAQARLVELVDIFDRFT
jgi:DNA-binding FrmR family transcriptional regulator